MKKPKLLIIEDDDLIRRTFCVMFRRDFDVTVAVDGKEALCLILEGDFDVILSDFNMPEMDGQALYEAVTREMPEAARRMVFMSGCPNYGRARRFFSDRGCLEKPFDRKDAVDVLLRAASS